MTQKTLRRVGDKVLKMPGWFSWRHPTREAHDAARERYLAEHGRAARRRKAADRLTKGRKP